MNLVEFHKALFGIDPSNTPELLHIGQRQRDIYEKYPRYRGYSDDSGDIDLLIATFVMALAQTKPKSGGHVVFFLPPDLENDTLEKIKLLTRYLVRTRREAPGGLGAIKECLNQLSIVTRPWLLRELPTNWVSFGFKDDFAAMPEWMRESLLII